MISTASPKSRQSSLLVAPALKICRDQKRNRAIAALLHTEPNLLEHRLNFGGVPAAICAADVMEAHEKLQALERWVDAFIGRSAADLF